MNFNTKYFGNVTYSEEELIHFPDGLFGFEHLKDYLPIAFFNDEDSIISLQSVTDTDISFVIMNPFRIFEEYAPALNEADLAVIDSPQEDDISYYVICVIKEDMKQSTANLKCPIIINSITRCGKQVILDAPEYTFRHSLTAVAKEEK